MQKETPKPDKDNSIPQMPFDEALRRMLNTPPKHESKKEQKKTGK